MASFRHLASFCFVAFRVQKESTQFGQKEIPLRKAFPPPTKLCFIFYINTREKEINSPWQKLTRWVLCRPRIFAVPRSAKELYFQIAKGKIDLTKIRELESKGGLLQLEKKVYVRKKSTHPVSPIAKVDKSDTIIIGENFKDIEYQMASCCNPIPGDDVFGFVMKNQSWTTKLWR